MPTPPVLRRTAAGAVAALAVLALSGCLSIKAQTASQRAPGVVTLGGVVCASDYDRSEHDTCHPGNVVEQDEVRVDATAGLGQMLVGFRVPVGMGAPDGFAVDGRAVTFERRPEYAAALQARFPAPAGQQWEGYLSSPKAYAPDSGPQTLALAPEFTLPAGPGGAPFAGPLRWRMVVGFRQLADAADAAAPADCTATTGATACVDAPQEAAVPVDLSAPVSDFGVLGAPAATARAGTTATLAFPVALRDDAALGALDVALAAATDVPGAVAAAAAPSVRLGPGDSTVAVSVPLPEDTPPGSYAVSLTASAGAPAVTRAGRATLVVTAAATDADGDGVEDRADALPGRAARALRHGPRRVRRALPADPGRDERHVARRGEGRRARLDEAQGPAARRARAAARRGPPDAHRAQPDARGQAPARRAAAARQGLLGRA